MSWLSDRWHNLLIGGVKVSKKIPWCGEENMNPPDLENHDIEHQKIEDVVDFHNIKKEGEK